MEAVTGKAAGTCGDAPDARAFRRAPVTADAPPGARARPDHTMWMPRSCRSMCMVAASTPYDVVRAVPE